MKKIILILVCLPLMVLGQTWQPAGYTTWQNPAIANEYQTTIGGNVANYYDDVSWNKISNTFQNEGDSVAVADSAILKTRVGHNGQSIVTLLWEGVTYEIVQKPIKLIWYKLSTQQWIDIFPTGSWGTPNIDSNLVRWTNVFPGVDYAVRKSNGSVGHGVLFKPAFLDSAVALYNERPDSLDIYLGNVIKYTLSATIDSSGEPVSNNRGRILRRLGRYAFELTEQSVHFPGSDSIFVPVYTRWVKQGGIIYCAEYVKMSHIKQIHETYPSATIWHNDETSILSADVEDTYINSKAAPDKRDLNYGGKDFIQMNAVCVSLVRVTNVATNLSAGATITACVCSLNTVSITTAGNVSNYRVFKPWIEGTEVGAAAGTGTTHYDWSRTTLEWGTSQCACANDDGVDNSQDGTCDASGRDRKATAEESEAISSTGWYMFDIATSLAQGWYNGTIEEEGVLFLRDGADLVMTFESTEDAVVASRPRFSFTYTVNLSQMIMISTGGD